MKLTRLTITSSSSLSDILATKGRSLSRECDFSRVRHVSQRHSDGGPGPFHARWVGLQPSLHFTLSLQSQSAFYPQSAVCSLHFTLSLHFTPGLQSAVCSLQSAFYTDRLLSSTVLWCCLLRCTRWF